MSEQTNQPKDELIGKTLGKFEILEEIGRGGMATVYRARQLSMNRIVAVKVLPRHFLHDPGFFERFEREVDVIAHLEHPHILPIYEYGKAEDVPYIAMRYLSGGSMAQMVRRGVPDLHSLEKPFRQIADALDYAHKQGIIHRDLKPGNVMLDENGNAYLSDFGIARVLGSNLTGSAIIGTPAYMSPEQANGLPLDARSDIYSMGIVLFELITGREPYQAETPMGLLLKHINEPVPPASMFRQGVPAGVEEVIQRSTAKDPNARYASTGEMAKSFSEALKGGTSGIATQPYDDMPTIAPSSAPRMTPPPTGGYGTPPPTPGYMTPPPTGGYGVQEGGQTYVPPTGGYGTPPPTPGYMTPPPTGGYGVPQTGTGYMIPEPRRSPLPMIIALVVVVAIIVVAALVIVPGMTPQEIPVTEMAMVLGTPTPFNNSTIVSDEEFSLSVPASWTFFDQSEDPWHLFIWQPQSGDAFLVLALLQTDVHSIDSFRRAAREFDAKYLDNDPHIALIDELTAPDGTLRRSFRLDGASEPPFPPGQMDVFYIARDPYLAVIQVYSADSLGDSLVPTFQMILDSLRTKAPTAG
ncbi:MAG: protein kinase [Anaerolineaceae bacterium]|nr:protein kinase [Anaerolineaceae bacterium]